MRSHDSPLPFPTGRQSVAPVLAVNPTRLQGSCLVGALERCGVTAGAALQQARRAEASGDAEALAAAQAEVERLEPGTRARVLAEIDRYRAELDRLAKDPAALLATACRGIAVMAARKREGR